MAGTKSYEVKIAQKSTVAGVQLSPGEYRVKIENSKAIFSNEQSGQVVEAPVIVTDVDKKYEMTEILTSKASDELTKIEEIEINGTKFKLEFKN